MEQKEINTFFFISHVTFPQNLYYIDRKSNKKVIIMTYIIQHRIIRICENEKDYGKYFKELLFPSLRQEHRHPITLIRL